MSFLGLTPGKTPNRYVNYGYNGSNLVSQVSFNNSGGAKTTSNSGGTGTDTTSSGSGTDTVAAGARTTPFTPTLADGGVILSGLDLPSKNPALSSKFKLGKQNVRRPSLISGNF